MAYRLEVKRTAGKALRRLPRDVQLRAVEAIDALAGDPRPHGCVKLRGHEALYRIRLGDWCVIYGIDDDEARIVILAVKHRRESYRDL